MSFFGWNSLHPLAVHLMWPVLALVGFLVLCELRRRSDLAAFVSPLMQSRLATRISRERSLVRIGFVGLALVAAVVALMRPQSKGEVQTISAGKASADIIVVLDVSKSMLAEDAAPNRLARAKAEVGTLLDNLTGHRVGLVAFAGRATVLCPLTPDDSFFRMILRGVDTASVSRGGTRIGDAIRTAIEAFGEDASGSKLILLITDGEDHDSYPLDAAKAALAAGIPIVSVGFGSEEGSQILVADPKTGAKSPLVDPQTSAPVVSRLDGKVLREMALTTKGAYIPAGVAALDLASIVDQHIEPLVRPNAETAVRVVPRELYPWFTLASLVALAVAAWLGAVRQRRPL